MGAGKISSDRFNVAPLAQKVARPHPSLLPPGEGAEICRAPRINCYPDLSNRSLAIIISFVGQGDFLFFRRIMFIL
jgi:hypothetical protein